MTQVVVHRCVMRIRRTAGWAWGDSPDALLAAATRALPSLIGVYVHRAIPETATTPITITTPVCVQVTATLHELSQIARTPVHTEETALGTRLRQAIDCAISQAFAAAMHAHGPVAITAERATESRSDGEEPDAVHPRTVEVRRALRTWHRAAILPSVLVGLDVRAVAKLHDAVFEVHDSPPVSLSEALVARAREARPTIAPATTRDQLQARLAIAASLLARDEAIPEAALRSAVDHVVAAPPRADVMTAIAEDSIARENRRVTNLVVSDPTTVGAVDESHTQEQLPSYSVASGEELEIRSVLPFLLLPPLHHAGWLAALATLLEVHELGDCGFALAAALAGKLLDPPDRGWMRTRDDRAIIAAFSGAHRSDAEAAGAGAQLAPLFGALDDTLRGAVATARNRDAVQIVLRRPTGWYLVDGDGMVVLAIAPSLGALLPHMNAVIAAPEADPATLDRLDLANLRFITDVPPTRGEPWRRFAPQRWTNDTATPAPSLAARMADLDDVIAHAVEIVEAIERRPAIPRVETGPLDATASLAATAALADLASRLFPAERSTPVLALTRFRDLDARVRFEPDVVRVRVPLGRRHADLMRHGFLTTIPSVPWLGGRAVDIGGA